MSDIIRRAAGYGVCDCCCRTFSSDTVLTEVFAHKFTSVWICDDCREELTTALTGDSYAYVIKTEHGYLPNEDYRVEYWEEGYWAQNLYEAYFFMDKETAQGFIGNIVPPPCCGELKECKVLKVTLIEGNNHD